MLKVTDVVEEIISQSFIPYAALRADQLNLSAYARSIRKDVELRTKKSVRTGTIVTALSRLQTTLQHKDTLLPKVKLDDIAVKSSLMEISYEKTDATQKALQVLSRRKGSSTEFFTVTQGQAEITIIAPDKWEKDIRDIFQGMQPKLTLKRLTSLTLRFSSKYLTQPNVLLSILMKLAARKLVVIEIISTFTEVSLILHEKDIEEAFSIVRGME